MTERVTRLLGLGLKAGRVVIGVSGVRSGLQRGEFACVVLASDAGERTHEKVTRLAKAKGVPLITGPQADDLGAKLGRPPVQAVGVRDPALARGLIGDSR